MPTQPFLNLDDPFPTAYESSLIISSKVFFGIILPKSLGESGLGLRYESNGNKDKAWITSVKTGSVSGHYPQTYVSSSSTVIPAGPEGGMSSINYYKEYVAVDNDIVSIDFSGMTFKSDDSAKTSEWEVEMTFNMKEKENKFKYGKCHQSFSFSCNPWSAIKYSHYSLKVNVTMNATLGFHVTGNQVLNLAVVPSTNPFIDGDLELPAGGCKCNDREFQKSFLENLRTGMEPQSKSIFDKKFTSVSLFALKNILLPAKNIIELKEVFVPGDMIIFGNFTKET